MFLDDSKTRPKPPVTTTGKIRYWNVPEKLLGKLNAYRVCSKQCLPLELHKWERRLLWESLLEGAWAKEKLGQKIDHAEPLVCYSRAEKKLIAANRIEIGPLVAELCSAKVDTLGKFVQKFTKVASQRPDDGALTYMSCLISPRRLISCSFQWRYLCCDTMLGRGGRCIKFGPKNVLKMQKFAMKMVKQVESTRCYFITWIIILGAFVRYPIRLWVPLSRWCKLTMNIVMLNGPNANCLL